jgi:hypothetical protein
MKLQVKRKLTFSQRLWRIAVFWGIPMVVLELIGIPRQSWGTILVLAIPATLVGVLVGTVLEQWFVARLGKQNSEQ